MDVFTVCGTLAGLVAEVLLATLIVAFVERNDSWPERTRSGPAMRGGGWLRLRRVAEWGGWGAYSISASVATLVLIGTIFGLWAAGVGGLMERLLFLELLTWYVIFGWRLFRGSSPASSPTSGAPFR